MVIDEQELCALRAKLPLGAAAQLPATAASAVAAGARDAKGALALAQAALVLDPCNCQALRVVGRLAAVHGDVALAKQAYQRVLLEDPHDAESAHALADIYRRAGRPDIARGLTSTLREP